MKFPVLLPGPSQSSLSRAEVLALAICLLVPWGKWGGGARGIIGCWQGRSPALSRLHHSMVSGITHSRGIMQHLLVAEQKGGKESL